MLVLHPHPLYGGEMDNHVVTAICDALSARGATTLRFNFRGAGRSQGVFDDGRGEAADALAAAAVLRDESPQARFLLVGYSFGSKVAAAVAPDLAADALVLVSPIVIVPLDPMRPTLLITGELDVVAPAAGLTAFASPACGIEIVPGADHGWWPGVNKLTASVTAFVESIGLFG